MRPSLVLSSAALLSAMAAPLPAAAHPHVFIDTAIALIADGDTVTGIRIVWQFDELYSSFVLEEFGVAPETGLTEEAEAAMRTAIFDELGEYGYFTEVRLDGAPLEPLPAHGFTARLDGAALVFGFEIALPDGHGAETIDVVAYDDEYFIYYAVIPGLPRLVSAGGGVTELDGVTCTQTRFLRDTFWLGPTDVEGVACTLPGGGS